MHRVVQESLTNAARHAPGAEVRVEVAREAEGITVTVANGAATSTPDPSSGGGSGLDGLRERVRLLEGTLRAGPDGAGGFTVTAQLPENTSESEASR